MDINEFVFIVMFLAYVGILLAKLYNVFSMGKYYDKRIMVLLLIGALLSWGVCFVISLHEYETLIFGTLHTLQSWFLTLHIILFLVELFMLWYQEAVRPVQAHSAMRAYGVKKGR